MFRIILSIVLLCAFSLGAEEEKTYTFKAKGKFAEELKELMKKHAKDGDVVIEEAEPDYYKSSGYRKSPTMLDSFLNNEDLTGDLSYGKEIYNKTCYKCHGKKAEKSSYPNARNLNTLSKKDLYYNLLEYKRNAKHGHSTKMIMQQQASGMTTPEMISVSAYIYSLSHSKGKAVAPINGDSEDEAVKNKKGVQGTYLQ